MKGGQFLRGVFALKTHFRKKKNGLNIRSLFPKITQSSYAVKQPLSSLDVLDTYHVLRL